MFDDVKEDDDIKEEMRKQYEDRRAVCTIIKLIYEESLLSFGYKNKMLVYEH